MEVTAFKTPVLVPPTGDLQGAIRSSALTLADDDCLVVSSKVVSISEGRCVPLERGVRAHLHRLARREAERYLEHDPRAPYKRFWTIVHGMLIGRAGVDVSNGGGYAVLWPADPQESARRLHAWACATYGVTRLAVVISDSRTAPLRRGAVGFAIGWAGFDPLVDHRNSRDLFDRVFTAEHTNLPDALAATAVLAMGETNESTPIVRVRGVPYLAAQIGKEERHVPPYVVSLEDDVYAPFFRDAPWKSGAGRATDPGAHPPRTEH